MPRYRRYATPIHFSTSNATFEAASTALRPIDTLPIRIRSDSIAPSIPNRATRVPKRAPLESASRTVGPGVAIATNDVIIKSMSTAVDIENLYVVKDRKLYRSVTQVASL